MKQWKKLVAMVMAFVFIVSLVQVNGSESVEASQKGKALKAYQVFLKENSWRDGEAVFTGKYFGLKDLNGDKIPELIINSGENKKGERGYSIIAYDAENDQAYNIYDSWTMDECYYNSAKNCIIDVPMFGDSNTKNNYYKIAFRFTKESYSYKELAVARGSGKEGYGEINGKKSTFKKAKDKVEAYAKKAKLLETPHKITKENIKKYVK